MQITIDNDVTFEVEHLESDTPPDDYNHYFTKKDLDANLLEGKPIKAMCGFVKEGLASPNLDKPTCPKCKWIYENVMQ